MISEELITQYERDGAVCVRQAVSRSAVSELLRHLDRLIDDKQDRWTTNRLGGFSDRHLWPTMPWMFEFCAHTDLPRIAATLMRSRYARLYFDHTFTRDPGTSHRTPWHQDQPYWPFQGDKIASVWVSLTACDSNSSGLRFIRGSHAWGKLFRPQAFGETSASASFLNADDAYEDLPDFDAELSNYEVLEWDMEPGDAIVFGAKAVHGSAPNGDRDNRRAAVSIRYVGDDARWDPRPGTDPMVSQDQVSISPGDPPFDDEWFPEVYRA